jgi:hypothetical protein
VDAALGEAVTLHCLGGFVMATLHGLPRPTNDVDFVEIVPHSGLRTVHDLAGPGSALARRHGLYFQYVSVASVPESYAERLTPLFPGRFRHLALFALDPHDLALSKLARNSPVDREDIAHLARVVPLDPQVLRRRYEQELRPIAIGDPGRLQETLDLWIEAYCGSG